MLKLFITVLLFLLMSALSALDLKDVRPFLEAQRYDLAADIQQKESRPLWDFENINQAEIAYPSTHKTYLYGEPSPYMSIYDSWYRQDFSTEPFDGRMQILVVGEPLPSPITSFFILFVVAGIITWNSNKLQRTAA